MENKDLQNEIVEKAAALASESTTAAANEALETKAAELNETLETKASKEEVLSLAKSIDEVKEIAQKNFNIGSAKRSPKAEMFKAAADGIANLKKGDVFNLNLKDFDAVASSDGYEIYQESRVDEIKYDPNHMNRLRNFIPMGQTNGGAVRFNQEQSSSTFGAAARAKESALPATNLDVIAVHEPVQTIGTSLTIAQEWLDDTAMIESYLSSRLIGSTLDVEDDQILTGDNTGSNFNGINTAGTTYTQATFETLFGDLADSFASGDANKFDALVATKAGMMNNNFRPSLVVLNPIDVASILLIKSDQNEYVLQQTVTPEGSLATFWNGLRVIEHPSQTSGTFTMIDPSAVQYWLRDGISFEFGYDASDFSNNNITARAIVRGAVTTYKADGAANGTFTNAENALTTGV